MDEYLDHYCERIASGLWGEPFNVISNVGFFITAYCLWRVLQKSEEGLIGHKLDLVGLLALMVMIGLGSTLWHLYATHFTLWMDRIPILLFINLYLLSCLFRVLRCSLRRGIGLFILYHILNTTVLLTLPIESLNRSLFYLPTWIFIGFLCLIVWRQGVANRVYYLWSFVFFTFAILFRSIDIVGCDVAPIGTHFIWHILVSVTLYFSMIALMDTENKKCSG